MVQKRCEVVHFSRKSEEKGYKIKGALTGMQEQGVLGHKLLKVAGQVEKVVKRA